MTDILIMEFETENEAIEWILQPAEPTPLPDVQAVPVSEWLLPVAIDQFGTIIPPDELAVILFDIGYYPCVANEQAYVTTLPDGVVY
ncbi:MAG: hypothetical protein IT320_28235 [Anaerolineae bacterium]|nr:hypothetical protein [Anaerolineae bacterium]